MFEFIIHYKDGSSTRTTYDTIEALNEMVVSSTEAHQANRNISVSFMEWGPVIEF